jgi:putative ABC transport system substrate-binding protein
LRDLGYVEGRNIIIEFRTAGGKLERFPELAADLVRGKVDVIVAGGSGAVTAAKNATSTIPIVKASVNDPIGRAVRNHQTHFITPQAAGFRRSAGFQFRRQIESQRVEMYRPIAPHVIRAS